MPNVEASLAPSPTIQPSSNTSFNGEATCNPHQKCSAGGAVPKSTASQNSARGILSITPVDCPSGAWCVIQGQSITATGFYWYPTDSSPSAGRQIVTTVSPTSNVTYTVNPIPVTLTPATFSITINTASGAQTGMQTMTIGGSSNDGSSVTPFTWPYYICDAKTGSCLTPTPVPSYSDDPCGDTSSNNPPGTTYGSKLRRSQSVCVAATPVPTFSSAPTPSLTPVPTLCPLHIPAPIPAKPLEIAARTAHVVIPFTDAALPCNGALTWKVTGAPAFFTNIHFGQSSTNVPHTNTLIFDVDRDTTPGDYPLNITLTSGSLVTSAIGLVTVRVPHVVLYDALENPSGIFELDQNEQVYVPDATQFA